MEGKAIHSTCFHHMVHRREPLVHSRAHGAEDEQGREVDVAHQRPPEQAAVLVAPVDTAGDEEHQPVRPGQVHKLVPPSVHYESDIKPCRVTGNCKAVSSCRHLVDTDAFSRFLAFLGMGAGAGGKNISLSISNGFALQKKKKNVICAWQCRSTQ